MPRTMFDKLWTSHVVADLGDGWALLHIDRHLLHDLSGGRALEEVRRTVADGAEPGTDLRHAGSRHFQRTPAAPGRRSGRARDCSPGCGTDPLPMPSSSSTWARTGRALSTSWRRNWASCSPA